MSRRINKVKLPVNAWADPETGGIGFSVNEDAKDGAVGVGARDWVVGANVPLAGLGNSAAQKGGQAR